jgi:serine/threonine protein kinase
VVVRYRLGSGASGVAFRAHHSAVERAEVAVKVVNASVTVRREALELQLASEHENVLRCFGTFRRLNLSYSIVALCRKTLEVLVRSEPLSNAFTFVYAARQLVAGLAYIHSQDVWHGDLK